MTAAAILELDLCFDVLFRELLLAGGDLLLDLAKGVVLGASNAEQRVQGFLPELELREGTETEAVDVLVRDQAILELVGGELGIAGDQLNHHEGLGGDGGFVETELGLGVHDGSEHPVVTADACEGAAGGIRDAGHGVGRGGVGVHGVGTVGFVVVG